MRTSDVLISDFTDPFFQRAFKVYFDEFGESVKDWERFFRRMNDDGNNFAYVRIAEDDSVVGFIQFKPISLSNWFFEERMGFIREFWVADGWRGQGHGSALLRIAEDYFLDHDVYKAILTTETAEAFYVKRGYVKARGITASNRCDVFVKQLPGRCVQAGAL